MKSEEGMVETWRVRLGRLYYVEGLPRLFKDESQVHDSYEFTTYKEAAWLFPLEFAADHIAESCGGVVEKVEITSEEYHRLGGLREYHVSESKAEWYKEIRESFKS